jgi:dienelactone hydrolase
MPTVRFATFLFLLLAALWPVSLRAEVRERAIEYRDGNVVLEGFLAYDESKARPGSGRAPGVLIIHQWLGLTENERMRARMLAELGYVAFAADIYGKEGRPRDRGEAPQAAGKYKGDRQLFRRRLLLGLEELRRQPGVDPSRIAGIGYCFGGTGALELARTGADLRGVVSFHGGLDSPNPEDGKKIKAKVLVLHGAADPFVPQKDIEAFKKELDDAKVDWQMVYYAGAVHAFTQKEAGNDPSKGAAYDARADRRSWSALRTFFDEVLAPQK